MTQLFIIRPDSKIELREHSDEPLSLAEIQEIVGSNYETVPSMYHGTVLISNKDGKQLNLPTNSMATDCLRSNVFTTLFGNVVWLEHKNSQFYGFRPTRAKILKDILEEAEKL